MQITQVQPVQLTVACISETEAKKKKNQIHIAVCINPNAPIKRHKGWLTKGCHISYCAEHLPQASETEIIMAPRTGEVSATAGRLVCPRRLSEAEPRSPAARSGAPSGLALPSLGRCSTEAKGNGHLTSWPLGS